MTGTKTAMKTGAVDMIVDKNNFISQSPFYQAFSVAEEIICAITLPIPQYVVVFYIQTTI